LDGTVSEFYESVLKCSWTKRVKNYCCRLA